MVVGQRPQGHAQRLRVEARGGRDLLVIEARVDAGPGFGVVLRAQVAPDRRALRLAVAIDEGLVEERARHLVAAADGEDGLDERRGGDDVGRLPGLERNLQQRVLGRHLGVVCLRLGDVLVDPVDEGLGVVGDLLPFGRLYSADDDRVGVLGGEIVDLLLQLALAVPGDGSDAAVHRRVRR